jgi:hypothetical protein
MENTSTQVLIQVIATVSALTVAFVAGGFSLLGLIIAKEQKISEFRQAWIDALRSDLAMYVAKVTSIKAYIDNTDPFDPLKLLQEYRNQYDDLNQAAFRIKLRVNSTESESQAILESMTILEKKLNGSSMEIKDASSEMSAALNRLEIDAPVLLKKEWKRVKRGERTYRIARWAAIVFTVLLIVFVIGICYHDHVWPLRTSFGQVPKR